MATTAPSGDTRDAGGTAPYCGGQSCELQIAGALALVGHRWAVPVLEALHFEAGAIRFRELQRRIGAISQKELARQLSTFVNHGVVERVAGGPPSRGAVRYALTARGGQLLRRIETLGEWFKKAAP